MVPQYLTCADLAHCLWPPRRRQPASTIRKSRSSILMLLIALDKFAFISLSFSDRIASVNQSINQPNYEHILLDSSKHAWTTTMGSYSRSRSIGVCQTIEYLYLLRIEQVAVAPVWGTMFLVNRYSRSNQGKSCRYSKESAT